MKWLTEQIENVLDNDISVEARKTIALNDLETEVNCKKEMNNICEDNAYLENLNQDKEIVESIVNVKDIIASMITKEYDYWKCTECEKTIPEKNNMKRDVETHVK